MANKPFDKFIEKKESGAKKKERIRQEKKKIRLETKAYFEKKKEEARMMRAQGGTRNFQRPESQSGDSQSSERPRFEPRYNRETAPQTRSSSPRSFDKPAALPLTKNPSADKGGKETQEVAATTASANSSGQMPLNKFVSHAGICSRRDAAELVKSGKIIVNGKSINEPGFKVSSKDQITYQGKILTAQRNLVYILLNKPKDFITTTEDPQGRKTVLDLVKSATMERVYPIGRLDRNTTGVLLLTNDGELAQKLSHPSYEIRKIYEVTLDKQLTKKDFETIMNGVTLEDGSITPDALAYPDPKNKHIIGIEIHSGRNRIVRRIFEHLGYDVKGLDRVMYANLTKKNVERSKWRFLSEKEVRLLKYLNASYKKKNL